MSPLIVTIATFFSMLACALYAVAVVGYVVVEVHKENGGGPDAWVWTGAYLFAIFLVFAGGYWLRGVL